MIKANELRLGNFYEVDGSLYKINRIQDTGFVGELVKAASGMHTNGGRRVPIPLSKEVLERCGFEQDKGMMSWEKEGVKIAYETIAGFFRLYPYTTPLTSLHELQNLYYALAKTELEYKP